jgi:FkbM family methyltransferase
MASSWADSLQAARRRSAGVPLPLVFLRLILWRLCCLAGVKPVIRAHGASRLRMVPVRGDHGIAKGVFLLRDGYEPSVREVIDAVLRPGDVAMDIGANMGLWSLRMAERVGSAGRVLAFEPGPLTQTRLRDNIALSGFGQIEVHALALGADACTLTLHTPADSGSASFGAADDAALAQEVPVERLDRVWEAAGRPDVRLVKMDTEGAEAQVLDGATAFFAACRPVVCCEINPPALARLGAAPADVMGFFARKGYRAMIWDPDHARLRAHSPGTFDTVEDIVFLPQEAAAIANISSQAAR